MFQKKPVEKTELDEVLSELFRDMKTRDADSEEYAKMADQVTKLYKLKQEDKPQSISYDNLALIAGNLLGIVLIVGHERAHVVTSKALNFVRKI